MIRPNSRSARVLMVDASDRGGIARYTAALVSELRREGVDVALAAPDGREVGTLSLAHVRWGHEVEALPRWARRPVLAWEFLRRAVSVVRAVYVARPDVVHLQTAMVGLLDPFLFSWWRRRKIRVIRTVHNAVAHDTTRAARRDRRAWARADVLIAHSQEAVAELRAAVPGADVRCIPVDVPSVSPPSRVDARAALGLDDGPLALLLGLIRPYKGVDLLGAAWPAVRATIPEARLAVVGSLLEPFAALDDLRGREGVDVRIGWISDEDVVRWAVAADLCVLPYAHGAHSGVLHQAVAAGTPVLASPALAEEVERFAAGRVVELRPEEWSAAMTSALGREPLAPPKPPGVREQGRATVEVYSELVAADQRPWTTTYSS